MSITTLVASGAACAGSQLDQDAVLSITVLAACGARCRRLGARPRRGGEHHHAGGVQGPLAPA
ncbi:MAG: hypothetical protein ACK5WT_00435 [Betaproteobacteria bacterium]